MDEVHNPIDSKCCTLSSELYRFYSLFSSPHARVSFSNLWVRPLHYILVLVWLSVLQKVRQVNRIYLLIFSSVWSLVNSSCWGRNCYNRTLNGNPIEVSWTFILNLTFSLPFFILFTSFVLNPAFPTLKERLESVHPWHCTVSNVEVPPL
jgi:hypothetical protein